MVDFITNNIYSTLFSMEFSKLIRDPIKNKASIIEFYRAFVRDICGGRMKVPFSPGQILGNLYTSIVLGKEHWYDLIPDIEFSSISPEWGLNGGTVSDSVISDPSLKHVITRLRNALGHGNLEYNLPKGLGSHDAIMKKSTIKFHDERPNRTSNYFDAEFTLEQLFLFNKQFQSIIHKHVRAKYGVKDPKTP